MAQQMHARRLGRFFRRGGPVLEHPPHQRGIQHVTGQWGILDPRQFRRASRHASNPCCRRRKPPRIGQRSGGVGPVGVRRLCRPTQGRPAYGMGWLWLGQRARLEESSSSRCDEYGGISETLSRPGKRGWLPEQAKNTVRLLPRHVMSARKMPLSLHGKRGALACCRLHETPKLGVNETGSRPDPVTLSKEREYCHPSFTSGESFVGKSKHEFAYLRTPATPAISSNGSACLLQKSL